MLLDRIESAIASTLKAPMEALSVRVRVTPDTDNSGVNSRGYLIVGYTGSSFSGGSTKVVAKQERTLNFELSLVYKDLQSHKDNYTVIETILSLLTGFLPIDCDGMYGALYPTRDGFVQAQDGYWRYSITFALVTYYPTLED